MARSSICWCRRWSAAPISIHPRASRASPARASARNSSMLIYGINAIAEALKAGRVVSMRAGRRKDQRLQQLLALAEQASVPVRRVSDDELDRESGGSSHQGVI